MFKEQIRASCYILRLTFVLDKDIQLKKRLPPWFESELDISPIQFEKQVTAWLSSLTHKLKDITVEHDKKIKSHDGEYQIDIYCQFEMFGGDFKVLVECKRHKNPIKRDVVQLLHGKLESIGAHKGFIVATTGFQKGAIQYATQHGIALVRIIDGEAIYETKSTEDTPVPIDLPQFAGEIFSYSDADCYNTKLLTEEYISSLDEEMRI
ncbi:restriction endonuclease [Photobacterium carnosum]|jgi:restriction system protein|uniref:restriction endonuclease n=1 Tax=Photobacterium carnosum TaxID=2023717 RepID=UPI001E5A54C0|nr:restriction endonuclease [Photobacterium carnosum]